jgi:hypothetical protein
MDSSSDASTEFPAHTTIQAVSHDLQAKFVKPAERASTGFAGVSARIR